MSNQIKTITLIGGPFHLSKAAVDSASYYIPYLVPEPIPLTAPLNEGEALADTTVRELIYHQRESLDELVWPLNTLSDGEVANLLLKDISALQAFKESVMGWREMDQGIGFSRFTAELVAERAKEAYEYWIEL